MSGKPKHLQHGQYGTPAYRSWDKMIQRCCNPNTSEYVNYGGRGITVCERWYAFENFFADMGPRPKGWTIDRIDVNGNYEPGNCRWIPKGEQSSNTRVSRHLTAFGETKPALHWAKDRRCQVGHRALYHRLDRGWSHHDAIATPPIPRHLRGRQ